MKGKIIGIATMVVVLILIAIIASNNIGEREEVAFLPYLNDGTIDTVTPPMFDSSLYYGMDTSANPCNDFYNYVNGGWRSIAVLPESKGGESDFVYVSGVNAAVDGVFKRIRVLIDSALSVPNEILDPNLRTVATFYQSCMVADSLDIKHTVNIRRISKPPIDSSRSDQCFQRVLQYTDGATGQLFIEKLKKSSSTDKMDKILSAITAEAMNRIASNRMLSEEQKIRASESLSRLKLRVGIPEEEIDYSQLILSKNDYHQNIRDIKGYLHQRWAKSIGSQQKDQWVYGLIRANANYIPTQHAIEIPPVWFFPPFFYEDGDDALNFAGVGWVIGHEIYHSIDISINSSKRDLERAKAIDSFVAITSSLGTVDGWGTDGRKTLIEDLADLGGVRTAYYAWKKTLPKESVSRAKQNDNGFTPDQQFFIAMGRFWRAKWKWQGKPAVGSHAAPFARVNGMVIQIPEFPAAFGCKVGDRMFLPPDRISPIW